MHIKSDLDAKLPFDLNLIQQSITNTITANKTMPRIEVFSDFDGTISMADTGCILIDSGMGYENRRKMDGMILRHEMSFL